MRMHVFSDFLRDVNKDSFTRRGVNGVGWLLAMVLPEAVCWPRWEWETVQTYVHCANTSGPWYACCCDITVSGPSTVTIWSLPSENEHVPSRSPTDAS